MASNFIDEDEHTGDLLAPLAQAEDILSDSEHSNADADSFVEQPKTPAGPSHTQQNCQESSNFGSISEHLNDGNRRILGYNYDAAPARRGSKTKVPYFLQRLRKLGLKKEGNQEQTGDNSAARGPDGIDLSKVVDFGREGREARFRREYAKKCNIREKNVEAHWGSVEKKLQAENDYLVRTSAEYIHRVNMMIDLEVDEVDQHNFLNEKVSHLEDQMRSLQRPDACLQAEIAALKAQMEKAESKVYQYQRQSIKELILNQKLIDRHELVLTAIRDRHGWFYEEHGECPC
ncbi:uncharacterized protein LOC142340776 [Convolutriloba macropyga]|uniref:uncharacterized protein LOC142340776 n=1 Tax=Convolutriloba macropyga TaxID=536237 RepID=UPI003F522118